MHKAWFDKFAREYRSLHAANIKLSGETPEYFAEYKIRDVAKITVNAGRKVSGILDFGAGVCGSVPFFRKYFPKAQLTCVDVSEQSLMIGESRFPGQAKYQLIDGKVLPFPDQSFDLAFAACVFHHMERSQHVSVLRELHRVLRLRGNLVVFEHNPLNPLTVHAVNTCPFDAHAELITGRVMRASFVAAGFPRARVAYRIFFPHFLKTLRPLDAYLTWLPLGAQYFVAGEKSSCARLC